MKTYYLYTDSGRFLGTVKAEDEFEASELATLKFGDRFHSLERAP